MFVCRSIWVYVYVVVVRQANKWRHSLLTYDHSLTHSLSSSVDFIRALFAKKVIKHAPKWKISIIEPTNERQQRWRRRRWQKIYELNEPFTRTTLYLDNISADIKKSSYLLLIYSFPECVRVRIGNCVLHFYATHAYTQCDSIVAHTAWHIQGACLIFKMIVCLIASIPACGGFFLSHRHVQMITIKLTGD